jgi:ankyrin repeat protein
MEQQLYKAAKNGRVEEVRTILKENKEINVNWRNEDDHTTLHVACNQGHKKIVILLLAHPDIDVNQTDILGWPPFLSACFRGRISCVRLLLKDPRVKLNEPDNNENTPLSCAALEGHLEVIKLWIASGRELDLGEPGNDPDDAIEVAMKEKKTEVGSLLERFKANPEKTRHEVRVELGCFDVMAAEMFALVIFHSDGLLKIKG